MVSIESIKDELIEELWIPLIKEGAQKFYPKLKKNKKMKLLSLTDDSNFNEIIRMEEEKLNRMAEDNVLWTTNHLKRIRLETEAVGIIFSDAFYGDSIEDTSDGIPTHFPRDILNLDFSFQKDSISVRVIPVILMDISLNMTIR